MKQITSAPWLITLICATCSPARATPSPLPEPLAALAREVEAGRAEHLRRYESIVSDDAAEQKLMAAEHDRVGRIARRALDLAEQHEGEPLALAARIWVVNGGLGSSPETVEAFRLLCDKHLADTGLGPAVDIAPRYTRIPEAEKLLHDAWAKSPHHDVGGKAGYGLAWRLQRQSSSTVTKLPPEEAATKAAEAEQLLELLAKQYADVPTYRGTVGSEAKALLFRMRNSVPGKPAPDFGCTDASGKPVRLSDLKGRVVVMDFWYVGCGPCRAQFPHLRQLVERHVGQPFTLVGISRDEDRGEWEAFLKKEQLPWTQWQSGPKGVVADWSISSFPMYYVVDAKGVIRFVNPRGGALDDGVERLLGETKKAS
jgi:peroxiredoxin